MQKIDLSSDCFRIEQICESGQCFRLDKTKEDTYEVIASGRYLEIKQYPDKTSLSCTRNEYEAFWKTYFDLDVCYQNYINSIDEKDTYLKNAAEYGSGIRILKQDVWEMVVSFLISQQNNIPRIKKLIRALCQRYGEKKKNSRGKVYYTFPKAERLARVSEEEFRAMKLGYRSRYLRETARAVSEGEVCLGKLEKLHYEDAKKELMRLCGVGEKVADCICLFALHKMDAFPVDTHIRQVLDREYREGFPFARYQGYAGVLQQYIFYYDLKRGRA